MRYCVHLCFNGSKFAGWQKQLNAVSVQEVLENSLSVLLKDKIDVTGCGRTDTGVHAVNFFAHFDFNSEIEQFPNIVYHLNSILPKEIHVYNIFKVNNDWNARFSATSRKYIYKILSEENPFMLNLALYVPYSLDLEKMQNAATQLVGTHDFTSFAKLHGGQKNGICDVKSANFFKKDSLIIFEITANRFLRNMVRSITGTLIDIGRGHIDINDFQKIKSSLNRQNASASAPAHALYLANVSYENDAANIFKNRNDFL